MFRRLLSVGVVAVLAVTAGCGGMASVTGVVTLDGTPVEGALVTFMKDDKSGVSATGLSDASGNFKLTTKGKPGCPPGDYKVVVTKTKNMGDMKPGSPEYLKMMAEMQKAGGGGGPPPVGGVGGPPMPGAPGGAGAGLPKSELPQIYATMASTPLTAKVPTSGGIKVELKKDAK